MMVLFPSSELSWDLAVLFFCRILLGLKSLAARGL